MKPFVTKGKLVLFITEQDYTNIEQAFVHAVKLGYRLESETSNPIIGKTLIMVQDYTGLSPYNNKQSPITIE
jgi:hypothetical protein